MNNKKDLLKLKKIIVTAAMSSMFGLTACSAASAKNKLIEITANDEFKDCVYTDKNGDTVMAVKPRKVYTEKGFVYAAPKGFELHVDKYGNPYCTKVMESKTR